MIYRFKRPSTERALVQMVVNKNDLVACVLMGTNGTVAASGYRTLKLKVPLLQTRIIVCTRTGPTTGSPFCATSRRDYPSNPHRLARFRSTTSPAGV
jgi:hypothetical protein